MRERLRVCVATCLYYSGIVKLVLWCMQRSGRRLIILNYHRAGGNLRAQLRYLQRHYRVLPLEAALEEFFGGSGPASGQQRRDRRIPLVVTFDDGYLDNYTYAFPLACHFQIPMTVFVIPGYVESGEYFWWLAARKLVKSVTIDRVTLEGRTYDLRQSGDYDALVKQIDTYVRYAPSVAEREARLVEMQHALGISLPRRITGKLNDAALSLTWEQIREMEQSGWFSFGAHTVHHPILGFLADTSEVEREIAEARMLLEAHLGHPVYSFAYPVGKLPHIGEAALQAVKSAGYKWAVTTLEAENTQETDHHLLRRYPGDVALNWMVMAAELAGLLGFVSRLRKKYAKLFQKRYRARH